jgi:DNA-binding FadR family transcriptional regulator
MSRRAHPPLASARNPSHALIQHEHRRIYEAIESGEPRAARDAMRRHLTRSLERYRKLAAEQKNAA